MLSSLRCLCFLALAATWLATAGRAYAADAAALAALRAAVTAAAEHGPLADDLVIRSNLPLARLKLRKAELLLTPGKYEGPTAAAAEWEVRQGFEALARIGQGRRAYEGEHGGFNWPHDGARLGVTREASGGIWPSYYEYGMDADTDGSPQPFLVEVPPGYDSSRSWPLLVYLHGYHGSVDMIRKWDTTLAVAAPAKENGYLVVAPHGRSETDFLGVGEADVLQAVQEVQRYYRVDPERLYLIGGSMGGFGALNLALHYPHLWAGVAAFTASTDMLEFGGLPRDQLVPFRRWHYLRSNPIDLAGNAPLLPILGHYGGRDAWVPAEHGAQFAAARTGLAGLYEWTTAPDGGHEVGNAGPAYHRAVAWFNGKRCDPWPRLVRHQTFTLRYDRSYWVRLLQLAQWGDAAAIEARVDGNMIAVSTRNVAAYELALDAPLVDLRQPVVVLTNGMESFRGMVTSGAPVPIHLTPARATRLAKTRTLCGPIDDAFNYPFLVVRGTIVPDAGRRAAVAVQAEAFRRRWEAYSDGWPRMKDDTDVTAADIAAFGLVLLGRPSENALTARVATGLPVAFVGDAFEVRGRRYEGKDVGLALVHPNPLCPSRYVAVFAGAEYGRGLPVNHPFDLLPDLLVFRTQPVTAPADGASAVFGTPDTHLCAGFFDSAWQIDDRTLWLSP